MKAALTTFLIDDDLDDQEIFSIVMKDVYEATQCIFANDGIEALKKLRTETSFIPHVIFIDINMPRMNGVQCLAEIKKFEYLENIPVFMYSTSAEPTIVAACKELGATGFIKKYTDTNDLKNDLARIVSQLNLTV